MSRLIERIIALENQSVLKKNEICSFLPYRGKTKDLDFESASCRFLSCVLSKEVKRSYTFERFKSDCLDHLREKVSDISVVADIEKMYFTDETVSKTVPEFLLLQSKPSDSSSKHITSLLHEFCRGQKVQVAFDSPANFVERIFLDILTANLRESSTKCAEDCYLPFVSKLFCRDVLFLSNHPDYFLEQIASFIELYVFIYCSQLGANIGNWPAGTQPQSQQLYFILSTEKSSSERSHLVNRGYQYLARPMAEVFPTLSVLEYFNSDERTPKSPLWAYAMALQEATEIQRESAFRSLHGFAERFRDARKLSQTTEAPSDALSAMQQLISYGKRQFLKSVDKERNDYQQKYMNVFDTEVAKNFIEQRGRSGKVLVINQDFVLLLTNLSIGERETIRFHELLVEFQSRGFYFDKSSQQALLAFYERVGNVDRMSDSGDAVYVRNTI